MFLPKNVPANTANDGDLLGFLLKLSSHHACTFASLLQRTLTQQHCASYNYFFIPKTF